MGVAQQKLVGPLLWDSGTSEHYIVGCVDTMETNDSHELQYCSRLLYSRSYAGINSFSQEKVELSKAHISPTLYDIVAWIAQY